jgi:hypothetical protein
MDAVPDLALASHNRRQRETHENCLLSCLLLVTLPAYARPTPIEKSIASPERTASDRERDKRDKPAEVMVFAGVRPGMVVADIFAGAVTTASC